MLGFLNKQEVLDDPSIEWLFGCFEWALKHFDRDIFHQKTVLVIPSNQFFPGRENSVEGMAGLILDQVKSYAGVGHWPTTLGDSNSCQLSPLTELSALHRGDNPIEGETQSQPLVIPYHPDQVTNPEALIASFAHTLAYYLAASADEPPPGGWENIPQAAEVLAVFMGFGVMLSNTAFNFQRGGCGSCGSAASGRSATLSQYDLTYALAIFARLKNLPVKSVGGALKKSLRSYFKQAYKSAAGRSEEIATLGCI